MNNNRIYVPNFVELRKLVMGEIHKVPYGRRLGYKKTITLVRSWYFGPRMKKYIVEYSAICMECQQVKVEH